MVGGISEFVLSVETECFDPRSNQWTYVARMQRPRSGLGLALVDKCIFAVGGYDGVVRLSIG